MFSQYRSYGNTLENCFSQISFYSYAYVRIIYEKTKGQVPLGPLLGKQNIQAKEVYYSETATYLPLQRRAQNSGVKFLVFNAEKPGKSPEKPGVANLSRLSRNSWKSPESQGKLFHSFWALKCKKGTELLTRMISTTLGPPLIPGFPGKPELKSLEKRRENFLKCTLMVSTLSKSQATLIGAKCCHHCNKITRSCFP